MGRKEEGKEKEERERIRTFSKGKRSGEIKREKFSRAITPRWAADFLQKRLSSYPFRENLSKSGRRTCSAAEKTRPLKQDTPALSAKSYNFISLSFLPILAPTL